MNPASCLPNWNWSVFTLTAHGPVTTLSYETTRIPAAHACAMTPLRPVGDAALITIASTLEEMRLSICWIWAGTLLPELKTSAFTRVL